MNTFDLSIYSLYRINGQEWPILPGLLGQSPPKKAARGREQDRLLVYLTLAGNVAYSTADYAQITADLASRYYETPGSVTFAIKASVEWLNASLAEKNMRTTGQGQFIMGALVLGVLRGSSLYFAQSGPTHVFWMAAGGGIKHFYDAPLAGKGLGLSQTAKMYFAQTELGASDRMLMCAALPPNWEKALMDEQSPVSADVLRRRLMAATQTNVSAALLYLSEGSGQVTLMRQGGTAPAETVAETPKATVVAEKAVEVAPAPLVAEKPVSFEPPELPEPALEDTPAEPEVLKIPRVVRRQVPPEEYSPEPKQLIAAPRNETAQKIGRGTARLAARGIHSSREAFQKLGQGFSQFIPRMLPDDEGPASRRASWPLFIALLIPILVVMAASTVYFEFGQAAQYEMYYQHAVNAGLETIGVQNPTELRVKWQATLDWLDKAEDYRITADSTRLRQDAQHRLDVLDRVLRLNFQPAFTSQLSKSLRVTEMAASDTDIYMLNNIDGSVMRGTLNGLAYELQDFDCKPGVYDGIMVGQLVDIVALSRSNPSGATLLGIDSIGNLLYCQPGEKPRSAALQMPDFGWGRVTAVSYDANNLYVLDPSKNAVWVYFSQPDMTFPDKPLLFFEEQIPPMGDVLSMAVNGDDLYLLHADGHLTTCTLSRISTSPTRCVEPATFIDTRPGFESGQKLADGVFTQVVFTPAPDPAVTLLEPYTQSIFRFSARALELQSQIRAQAGKANPFPDREPITAMTFSLNKVVFVFVGGNLYFAVNTP